MKKLSERQRRLLRHVYRGLGLTAAALGMQACDFYEPEAVGMYGMPPNWDSDSLIHGVVISDSARTPVPGIKVSVKDLGAHAYTDIHGRFYVYVPRQDTYKLKFEDVDGPENGSFQTLKKEITREESYSVVPLHIFLEDSDD